jgi:hypothetical protein
MGGRGSRSSDGSGIGAGDIISTTDLVSMRESGYQQEVDDVLSVSSDVSDKYGTVINDLEVANLKKRGTMAFYSEDGVIAVNEKYFNTKKMNEAYDDCVKSGFHPSRGKKSGMQATAAHEYGHQITDVAAKKHGMSLDTMANRIANEARAEMKHKGTVIMASKISRYATASNAEAIAEAFTDVYCNGSRANRESKVLVKILDKYAL